MTYHQGDSTSIDFCASVFRMFRVWLILQQKQRDLYSPNPMNPTVSAMVMSFVAYSLVLEPIG